MTSVYISSTYNDLIKYREAAINTILKMKKMIVSMEHYTASDERPLDKCLADVAQCDIYIGIFAFRYGFVPDRDNPNNLSITELEYQQARKHDKPCLIFIADETGWPMTNSDFYTGEGDRGIKIKKLRDQLNHEHTRTLFKIPEDLAASVSTAVANLLEKNQPRGIDAVVQKAALATPRPREITSDLFLTYSDVDAGFAADLTDYLNSRKVRTILDQRALFASTSEDFLRLERSVQSCHAAALLVSDTSLRQLEEHRKAVTSVFGILEARTENLFAICRSDESARKLMEWPLEAVERATGWDPRGAAPAPSLNDRLESLRLSTGLDSGKQWVGLPVIVVAMTRREANEIDANPVLIRDRLNQAVYQRFIDLRASVATEGISIANKYGASRLDCRPFAGLDINVGALLKGIVERLNDDQPAQLRGRLIKLQNYQFDELISYGDELSPIFTQLSSTGCVVIVDEYSLFHPDIQEPLVSSGLLANNQVSLVTLSPRNPYSAAPFDMLEAELRKRMAAVFNRFASAFDPQCELSVGDEKRLKRWLNASLPHTIQTLRDPKPNRQNISQFAREQGLDPQPKIAPLLYTEGGPL
jgi:Domain of unknown function (DUF4062)